MHDVKECSMTFDRILLYRSLRLFARIKGIDIFFLVTNLGYVGDEVSGQLREVKVSGSRAGVLLAPVVPG